MRPGTLLRLALAGTRTDTLRVVLTALSAALAALAAYVALTVLAIDPPSVGDARQPGWADQYTSPLLAEPGLRPGVAFTLLMMTVPVLALAGQCARIGAPGRDRRLAAVLLAGATPRQTRWIAVAETGLASLVGTAAGLALYVLLRALLHSPDAMGRLPLPTDVLPSPAALAAVLLGLPLVAAFAAVVMLRRVTVSPLDLDRRAGRRGPPRVWPGVLLVFGLIVAVTATPALDWYVGNGHELPGRTLPVVLAVGGLSAILGVVLGTGWISHVAGRLLHRFARRPAPLIAARQLQADPWNGSRTFAALLTCAVFASGTAAVRAYFVAQREATAAQSRLIEETPGIAVSYSTVEMDGFYVGTTDLISAAVFVATLVALAGLLVALAGGVVARRRTHAALAASGVPRSVLGRVLAWQTLAPVVPAVLLALGAGTLLGRGYATEATANGAHIRTCDGGPDQCGGREGIREHGYTIELPDIVRQAEVPWADLALYGSVTFALVLAAVGVGLLFLRAGTSVEELRTG
ncbi:hypothetical protein N566_03665 [Streptomycetaceae bacterium MP113-05]|nr:hypothetical protein N566_03665 [Streptomycetaceae bacterium MP113-05]